MFVLRTSIDSIAEHVFKVHGIRTGPYLHPHVCDTCGQAFIVRSRLEKHREMHNERNIVCSHCPMLFKTQELLNKHLQNKHGPKDYVCDVCSYRTTMRSQLELHIR